VDAQLPGQGLNAKKPRRAWGKAETGPARGRHLVGITTVDIGGINELEGGGFELRCRP
jgi:hypothetical protein